MRRGAPAWVLAGTAWLGLVAAALADANGAANDAHHLRLPPRASRFVAEYATPRVRLVRADGHEVWLADELDDGRPVVMDFVYTTCTTICPVSSQTFSELEQMLGPRRDQVHLVSVSIDPEEDTPQRLAGYSKRFDAGPQWSFYTGSVDASVAVQRAFGVYRGNKMSHDPVTLVRQAPGLPWARFDGFVSADQLLEEIQPRAAVR